MKKGYNDTWTEKVNGIDWHIETSLNLKDYQPPTCSPADIHQDDQLTIDIGKRRGYKQETVTVISREWRDGELLIFASSKPGNYRL